MTDLPPITPAAAARTTHSTSGSGVPASPSSSGGSGSITSPQRKTPKQQHIVITTHPDQFGIKPVPVKWFSEDPKERGPIIGTLANPKIKNAIGTHLGTYTVYRALAVAANNTLEEHKPDLTNTTPQFNVGPHPSWSKIVALDPWGAEVCRVFKSYFDSGVDLRPTIALTKAHIQIPELKDAIEKGRLAVDGKIVLNSNGDVTVTKAAIDPVWYIPGICERLGIDEVVFRRTIFEQTGGMFPELITRYDLNVFLPPIGGATIYILGEVDNIANPEKVLAARVHDECNGSDVFGSDICTCRPYLIHGLEVCIKTAQEGGAGVTVYLRKEGRALGEVVKYLVYNARKRQEGGDSAATYFERTKCVAGVEDARLQPLMPDVLHWLGITKIDKFVSMSDDKYDAITGAGIKIIERIPIPKDLIPPDAHVEINAKIAKGYFTTDQIDDTDALLKNTVGRTYVS